MHSKSQNILILALSIAVFTACQRQDLKSNAPPAPGPQVSQKPNAPVMPPPPTLKPTPVVVTPPPVAIFPHSTKITLVRPSQFGDSNCDQIIYTSTLLNLTKKVILDRATESSASAQYIDYIQNRMKPTDMQYAFELTDREVQDESPEVDIFHTLNIKTPSSVWDSQFLTIKSTRMNLLPLKKQFDDKVAEVFLTDAESCLASDSKLVLIDSIAYSRLAPKLSGDINSGFKQIDPNSSIEFYTDHGGTCTLDGKLKLKQLATLQNVKPDWNQIKIGYSTEANTSLAVTFYPSAQALNTPFYSIKIPLESNLLRADSLVRHLSEATGTVKLTNAKSCKNKDADGPYYIKSGIKNIRGEWVLQTDPPTPEPKKP